MRSLKGLGRRVAKDLQRTGEDSNLGEAGEWNDVAHVRRPHLSELVKGVALALAAGALITVAVVGAVITLVVVSLGPTHRHGPGDGRHSRRLPVAVVPASAVQEGESVQVHASRLAGAGQAIIAQCEAEAETRSRGVAACDLAQRSRVKVHHGQVNSSFRLSRSIDLRGGRRVNCGTESGRCVLMVASTENYDRSGFAALSFLHGTT
ncbi:MAG: hypothetical protein M3Z46_01250 [Actinomycetota bacterium]|nr:hypothetical protein [Actinomycetota bacterium]